MLANVDKFKKFTKNVVNPVSVAALIDELDVVNVKMAKFEGETSAEKDQSDKLVAKQDTPEKVVEKWESLQKSDENRGRSKTPKKSLSPQRESKKK